MTTPEPANKPTTPAAPHTDKAPAAPHTDKAPAAPAGPAAPAASAEEPTATAADNATATATATAADKATATAAAADKATAAADKPAEGDGTAIRTTDITAGPGGVMTNEVGVITGDLTLRTEYAAGKVTVHVQYQDADEWYVVTGGKAKLADVADLDAVHSIVVGILNRPEG
jgi:hypothetical protein